MLLSQEAQETPQSSLTSTAVGGRQNAASTAGQMAPNESFDDLFVDVAARKPATTEPAREVFGDLNVRLQAGFDVTAGMKIESETLKNYAEMASSHAAPHRRTQKHLLDHGDQ